MGTLVPAGREIGIEKRKAPGEAEDESASHGNAIKNNQLDGAL